MKLAIYARVSTRKQSEEGLSIDEQISIGIAKSQELKMEYEVFAEKGKSAFKETFENRPQMISLLDRINEFSGVFATYENRISRRLRTKIIFKKKLKENNVILYTRRGKVDFNNLDDNFNSDLLTMFDERESELTSKRIRDVLKYIVENGGVGNGGSIPYGYQNNESKFEVNIETKQTVKDIFQLCIDGFGTKAIANKLNERGIKTMHGKSWKDGTIYGILTNTVYIGKRRWNDFQVDCPAIISEELFLRAKSAILKRAIGHKTESTYKYLLNDLIYCKRCNREYRGRVNMRDGSNIYKCTSSRNDVVCHNKSINRPYLYEKIFDLLAYEIEDCEGNNLLNYIVEKSKPTDEMRSKYQEEIEEVERLRQEYLELFEYGNISKVELIDALKRFEKRSIVAKNKLGGIEKESIDNRNLLQFKKLNFEKQREIVKKIFGSIIIEYNEEERFFEVEFYTRTNELISVLTLGYKYSNPLKETTFHCFFNVQNVKKNFASGKLKSYVQINTVQQRSRSGLTSNRKEVTDARKAKAILESLKTEALTKVGYELIINNRKI